MLTSPDRVLLSDSPRPDHVVAPSSPRFGGKRVPTQRSLSGWEEPQFEVQSTRIPTHGACGDLIDKDTNRAGIEPRHPPAVSRLAVANGEGHALDQKGVEDN